MNGNTPDLMQILIGLGGVVPSAISMIQTVIAMIAFFITGSALLELWGSSHDNSMKYMASGKHFSVSSALVRLVIGALLLSLATSKLIVVLGSTLAGIEIGTEIMHAPVISYTEVSAASLIARTEAMLVSILGIFQVIGICAICKGLLTINAFYSQRSQAGWGTAACWIIGGLLCWNFKWLSDVVNNTVGFNLIGIMMTNPT